MVISSLAGPTPIRSLLILKEEWLFCIVPIGIYLFRKEKYRSKMLYLFILSVGLIGLYGIVQHFTGINLFKKVSPQTAVDIGYVVRGSFSHSMTFANYFSTALIFITTFLLTDWTKYSNRIKIILSIVCILVFIAVVFSYSRMAILGLFIMLGILGVKYNKKFIPAVLVLLIILISLAFWQSEKLQKHSEFNLNREIDISRDTGRGFIWRQSLEIIGANPVFGVGQGNFEDVYRNAYIAKGLYVYYSRVHAHNDLLNVAAIGGIPAMLFFLGIWVFYFRYVRKCINLYNQDDSFYPILMAAFFSAIMFFITSTVEATFADEEVRQLLMFIWAAGLWPLSRKEKIKSGTNINTRL